MVARRWFNVGLAVLMGALLLAGCQQQGGGGGTSGGGGQSALSTVDAISSEWAESTHAMIVTNAAEEAFCVQCHDGGAFAQGVMDPKQLNRTFPVATDCRACHTGKGKAAMDSGEASAPVLTSPMKLGLGAVCASCHRSLGKPDIADPQHSTPHHSPVIDIYSGEGGLRTSDMVVGSSKGHLKATDKCLTCHMADKDGHPSHTFWVDSPAKSCGGCHSELKSNESSATPTLKAKGDYDGNGTVGTFAEEVDGLLAKLDTAITEKADGAKYSIQRGQITFNRGGTTVTPTITQPLYMAIYNHSLITEDNWHGTHNPRFTVDLLQESFRVLTGSPIPNAAQYGKETSGTPGGSSGTTGSSTTTGGGG